MKRVFLQSKKKDSNVTLANTNQVKVSNPKINRAIKELERLHNEVRAKRAELAVTSAAVQAKEQMGADLFQVIQLVEQELRCAEAKREAAEAEERRTFDILRDVKAQLKLVDFENNQAQIYLSRH
mmetsp:Transcript_26829/g.37045  ORF Transcript_26829/g.37045 Transcript_26829/m.37045 type:complete len:125 (-) Transcript_26829:64-438(-)